MGFFGKTGLNVCKLLINSANYINILIGMDCMTYTIYVYVCVWLLDIVIVETSHCYYAR